jgi:ABC-type Fe3+-hydroxamate transport system substrate-binding protein
MDNTYRSGIEVPKILSPRRVVSLVPSVTESLFDLALGDRLVGVTDYCVRPAAGVARLPKIGGTKNADVERIIALRPDLVIANQEENSRADVEALQAAGITLWLTFPKTVQDALNLLWAMMELFDEPSMVPRVRLIEQTVDVVERMEMARTEPCRVFAPIWYDPLMTFNVETYAHDLLRVCGGSNVFGERERRYPLAADIGDAAAHEVDDARVEGRDTRYPRITLAEVEAMQPHVILLPSEPFAFDERHRAEFLELDVPAARAGRVHLVDGSLLTWHGTRIAYALTELPALFSITDNDNA